MAFMDNLTFSLAELVALLGLGQSLLLLIHIISRAPAMALALPYIIFFSILSLAFSVQLTTRLEDYAQLSHSIGGALWALMVPAAILMIFAMIRSGTRVLWRRYLVFMPVILAVGFAYFYTRAHDMCTNTSIICAEGREVFFTALLIAEALCFMFLIQARYRHHDFKTQKNTGERYWLMIVLIVVAVGITSGHYALVAEHITIAQLEWAQLLIGLMFVYLISTLIFRIYPPILTLKSNPGKPRPLRPEEDALRRRIEDLMKYDKLYQEPSFGRADLARELEVSETVVSNIVNLAFGVNLATYINRHRVQEAQYLLTQSQTPVSEIAVLVGFNSIASFNRVFKDFTGLPPSEYRKSYAEYTP